MYLGSLFLFCVACVALRLPGTCAFSAGRSSLVPPSRVNLQFSRGRFPPQTRTRFRRKRAGYYHHARMHLKETGEDGSAASSDDIGLGTSIALVAPLLVVYVSNQWSRSSLYYLVNFNAQDATSFSAMNIDLGFSEAQYGTLASIAFTALFAVTSLFAGSLADKYDRRRLTAGSAVVWSAATIGTAAATDYDQVLGARLLMGLACAFTTPAAYTLIRDVVPPERAALANSIYGGGIYLGGALSSLSILLDDRLGWRGAMTTIGIYGLVCAALSFVFLPSDPKFAEENDSVVPVVEASIQQNMIEEEKEEEASFTLLSDAQAVLSTPRVRWLFFGALLRFSSGLLIGVWSAPYYRLAFPDDSASYSVVNAFIVGICGVASGIFGGYLSDKAGEVAKRRNIDENAARMAVPIVGCLLAVPAWYFTVTADSFETAMLWLAVEYLVAECWFGPVVTVLQSSVDPKRGGTAQGMFTLTGALGNLSPSLLGFLYGGATAKGLESVDALSDLLEVSVCAGYLLSALCFFAALQGDGGGLGAIQENRKTVK